MPTPVTNTRRMQDRPAARWTHARCSGNTAPRYHRPHASPGPAPRSPVLEEAGLLRKHEWVSMGARRINYRETPDRQRWQRYQPAKGRGRDPRQSPAACADDARPPHLLARDNGEPLPPNGFTSVDRPGCMRRHVKWLTRIEVRDQRHAGNFMARDYVTIREEHRGSSDPFWTFSTVRHFRLKSAPAKVVRRGGRHVVLGAAWGAPIAAVQVRIDDGPWIAARLFGPVAHRRSSRGLAWQFWTFNWGMPAAGEHRVTSRAFDTDGNMQPAPNDPFLASKVTFWESNGRITRRVLIP